MTGLLVGIAVWALAASGGTLHQVGGTEANTSAATGELAIAAPDELNSALAELARQFEQKTSNRIRFTFADSSSLLMQIQNGAAFDAVFLPDMNDLRRLANSGIVTRSSVTEYARDQMVLSIAPGVRIEPRPGNPLLLLTDKSIARIAIASPRHTAFGKITVQALTAVHIYDATVKRKLLIGEDIVEVAQFMEKGDADVAVLPGSALSAYQLRGMRVIPIASNLYNPIRKGAGVLRGAKHPRQAFEFLKFAVSPDGKAIFRLAGFDEP
ncbi:MAG: molybdate ABC transporter substrate-binding protein [Candidatus Korobacteraceae bacterium]